MHDVINKSPINIFSFISITEVHSYNTVALTFSGRQCLLAAMPSKDAETHGHKWPALNHGIFYDY